MGRTGLEISAQDTLNTWTAVWHPLTNMSAPRRSARIAALAAAPAPAPLSTPVKAVKKRSAPKKARAPRVLAPWEIKFRKLARISHEHQLEYRIRQLQHIPLDVFSTSHSAREMFLSMLDDVAYDLCDLIGEIRSARFGIWERKSLNIYPEQEAPALQQIDKSTRLIRQFVEVATPIRNIVLDDTYDSEDYPYLFDNGLELWESVLEYQADLDYVLKLEF